MALTGLKVEASFRRGHTGRLREIFFFDWGADGTRDHVGIVKKCDGRTVCTIEGNSGDACKRLSYVVGSSCIYGYGAPKY